MAVQVAVYDSVKCQPPRSIPVGEVAAALREPDQLIWVDVAGVDAEAETLMHTIFHFHPLAIEDTHNQRQRPKVEEYVGYLFTILNSASLNGEDVTFTELDVFAGDNYIVTVHMDAEPCLEEARRRVDDVCTLKPVTTGYLLYILLDVVVDSYFPLLDRIGDEIEDIGDAIFEAPRQQSVQRLFLLKRTLNEMWRVTSQQRDMFTLLMRENNALVRDDSLRFYMRDVYDHLLRISDHITTFRETLTNVVDLYMSAVSNRLNQQVNRLTIITIGTGIVAVITGFYGMNFEKTWPPFSAPWGVPFVLSLILLTLIIILSVAYVRKQR
jgi:magnesium transporter